MYQSINSLRSKTIILEGVPHINPLTMQTQLTARKGANRDVFSRYLQIVFNVEWGINLVHLCHTQTAPCSVKRYYLSQYKGKFYLVE